MAVLVVGLGVVADTHALHLGAGVALIAFGIFRFVRPRAHFRWTKLRVNRRELGWWSFLMSTAHGAGLMVAPVLIGAGATAQAAIMTSTMCRRRCSPPRGRARAAAARRVDDARDGRGGIVVYEKLGVAVLRQAWVNTEWLWAGAFVHGRIRDSVHVDDCPVGGGRCSRDPVRDATGAVAQLS